MGERTRESVEQEMIFFLYLPFDLLMTIINYVFAPVIALVVNPETHNLPKWRSWFQTPDALMNGKSRYFTGNGSWCGGDYGFYHNRLDKNLYVTYTLWLWRNPLNGFEENVIGLNCDGKKIKKLGVHSINGTANKFQFRLLSMGWKSLLYSPWELYCLTPYFGSQRGLRLRIGWKMSYPYETKKSAVVQFVFVPNPFYKFEK